MTDRLELVAEQIHEGWMEYQARLGRVPGPERTERTHPHMIPWNELDNQSQNQDRFIAAVILDEWARGDLTRAGVARALHEIWRRWVIVKGGTHPHAQPYEIAHATGGNEHELQAARLEPILRDTPKERNAAATAGERGTPS